MLKTILKNKIVMLALVGGLALTTGLVVKGVVGNTSEEPKGALEANAAAMNNVEKVGDVELSTKKGDNNFPSDAELAELFSENIYGIWDGGKSSYLTQIHRDTLNQPGLLVFSSYINLGNIPITDRCVRQLYKGCLAFTEAVDYMVSIPYDDALEKRHAEVGDTYCVSTDNLFCLENKVWTCQQTGRQFK